VANTDHGSGRFSAAAIGGGTSRTLLVTGDPDTVISAALAAGASVTWRPGGRTNGKVSDAGPEETAHGLKIIPVAASVSPWLNGGKRPSATSPYRAVL